MRYEFVVNALLHKGFPVLLTGPVGTGKTSTAQSVLETLNSDTYTVLNVNMSAQTSSANLQVLVSELGPLVGLIEAFGGLGCY